MTLYMQYKQATGIVDNWMPGAEKTIQNLLKEPIAVEPGLVQQQIDKMEVSIVTSYLSMWKFQ